MLIYPLANIHDTYKAEQNPLSKSLENGSLKRLAYNASRRSITPNI